MKSLHNVMNASSITPLPNLYLLDKSSETDNQRSIAVHQHRQDIQNILAGRDSRMLVIIGPCSIHDPEAAIDYAHRLAKAQKQFSSTLKLVMRTYFEKPRTRTGWKGYMVDPDLNGQFNLLKGLSSSRELLKSVLALGVPTATEFLDTHIAPYIADLICWGAVGARTTESQPHRQLASALHCPIGFKNGTDGNTTIAIDAIHAANDSHLLIMAGENGQPVAVQTQGNPYCHIILRGGVTPNYASHSVKSAAYQLHHSQLSSRLVVDCSHGNSGKIAKNQLDVINNIAQQLLSGERHIAGVMCESFLQGGSQALDKGPICYGQSITDECLSWEDTMCFLNTLDDAVATLQQQQYCQPAPV